MPLSNESQACRILLNRRITVIALARYEVPCLNVLQRIPIFGVPLARCHEAARPKGLRPAKARL